MKKCLILLFIFELAGAANITYQGRLFNADSEPIDSGNVAVVLQIKDPSGDCLLFEETHSLDMDGKNGYFSLLVGGGAQNSTTAPNFTLLQVLSNTATLNHAELGCAGNTFTPAANANRLLRVSIDGTVLEPDQMIGTHPYAQFAQEANSLTGKTASDFLQDDGSNVSQAGLQNFFDAAAGLGHNQALRWNNVGSQWEVFTPGVSGGGVDSVTVGNGVTDSGTGSDPILSLDLGTGLQFNGSSVEVNQGAIDYGNIANTPDLAGDGTSSVHFNNLTNVPVGLADGDDDTTYSDAQMLAGVSNVDGTGSGLDSDLLDGQEGAHYLAWGNLTGVPADIADGDADSQLSEAAVDGFVADNGYFAADGSVAMGGNISLNGNYLSGDGQNEGIFVSSTGKVGIGTGAPGGTLDVQSTSGAFIPPRMTEAQRDGLTSPPDGSVIYNITSDKMNFRENGSWQELGSGGGGGGTYTNDIAGTFTHLTLGGGLGSWPDIVRCDDNSGTREALSFVYRVSESNELEYWSQGNNSPDFGLADSHHGMVTNGFGDNECTSSKATITTLCADGNCAKMGSQDLADIVSAPSPGGGLSKYPDFVVCADGGSDKYVLYLETYDSAGDWVRYSRIADNDDLEFTASTGANANNWNDCTGSIQSICSGGDCGHVSSDDAQTELGLPSPGGSVSQYPDIIFCGNENTGQYSKSFLYLTGYTQGSPDQVVYKGGMEKEFSANDGAHEGGAGNMLCDNASVQEICDKGLCYWF